MPQRLIQGKTVKCLSLRHPGLAHAIIAQVLVFGFLLTSFGRQFKPKHRSILSARRNPYATVMGFDYRSANR
jgi:hypothetical protein